MSAVQETAKSAEVQVVGAILLAPDRARVAAEIVTPADFADKRLAAAYSTMLSMHSTGQAIDEQTVAAKLATGAFRLTDLELFDCRSRTYTPQNIDAYARQVAEAAGMRRLSAFGYRATAAAESDMSFSEAMTAARGEWDQIGAEIAPSLDAPLLADVLDGPDDYDWLIPNLLERRDRLILTGGEGSGKSFLVQQIAILAAAGIHPTTFAPVDPVRVLVVDAENSAKQWRRRIRPLAIKARQRGSVDPTQTMRLATVPRLDITTERDLTGVHRLIDQHAPDILIIGPLYRLLPRAITSDDDAAPLLTALDGLRARGCALVMEAHAGHARDGAGERDLRPRGSSALMGWPEFGFGLRLLPPETDQPDLEPVRAGLIRWRGDRDERAWPHTLVRGGEWPWSDYDQQATAAAYQNRYSYQTQPDRKAS